MTAKTYTVAKCATGCAFHTTVDTTCRMCGGPLTAPVTTDRDGMLTLARNDTDYQAGKRGVVRQMLTARYHGTIEITDEMVDAVMAGLASG